MAKTLSRPKLTNKLSAETFKDFYWMKKELTDFCIQQDLSIVGQKPEISERIFTFLKSGKKLKPTTVKITSFDSEQLLTPKTIVKNYKNDSTTRQFFIYHIGSHFHFSARVNIFRKDSIAAGKKITYGDLIKEWQKEHQQRKDKTIKLPIMSSCEYNQFTRDYYAANPNAPRQKVIAAWKQARLLAGAHTYKAWLKYIK